MQRLEFARWTLERNAQALLDAIHEHSDPAVAARHVTPEGRADGQEFLREFARHLHNFLASTKSLVDLTRRVVKELYPEGSAFRVEYEQKLNADFRTCDEVGFVQQLRNYALHITVPPVRAGVSRPAIVPGEWESFLSLSAERLQDWPEWTGRAKAYVQALEEDVALAGLAERYRERASGFYEWLELRQRDHHADELVDLDAVRQELLDAQTPPEG